MRVERLGFLIFLLVFPVAGWGQQVHSDYLPAVLFFESDTLEGKIRKPALEFFLHDRIRFVNDRFEQVIYKPGKPGSPVALLIGSTRYEAFPIGNKRDNWKYLKVILEGYCTLYEYSYQKPRGHAGGIVDVMLDFYIKRPNTKIHRLIYERLISGEDPWFDDNLQLKREILAGVYKKHQMRELVARYNREKQ